MAKKILVVDDDPAIREIVRLHLQADGKEVVEARDGREAVKVFMDEKPDLVVLDIMMPELDGWQVCRYIRDSDYKKTPVIMFTARDQIKDKIQGIQVGADDYITKPFHKPDLLERVNKLLGPA